MITKDKLPHRRKDESVFPQLMKERARLMPQDDTDRIDYSLDFDVRIGSM